MFGNVIIPTDALHHFSEGWLNHQPVDDVLEKDDDIYDD
jgi:hypothetical protein